ncbi:MAG: Cof-type HAD-IIB family hydrolase [Treponema sp.]|nr:Cof-type HAD-IIB family hydrolase [Treponema sp.]
MMPIRLLALDLDDTLLRSDLSISYRTRSVIKKAQGAGVVVTLASGRAPVAMEDFSRLLGMNRRPGYLICNNGTVIRETNTGKTIFERRIKVETALSAFDLAAAEGFAVQIYEDDIMYVSRSNEFADTDQKLTGLRQVVVENFRGMVAQGVYKLIIPGDPMLLSPLESILRTYLGSDITLFTSRPYFLELLPAGTDKGTALAKVAETFGIKQEEVLAIGDSLNDEAMIRWAGIGVAMANGDERIKNIASLVTKKTNDDDGIVEVIEKYVLGKGK